MFYWCQFDFELVVSSLLPFATWPTCPFHVRERRWLAVPAIVSDAVVDVVAAAEKLRADDRLIASPQMLCGDAETLLDAITMLHGVLIRRLRDADEVDATSELYGRGMRAWLREELLLPGVDVSRLLRVGHNFRFYPIAEAYLETADI